VLEWALLQVAIGDLKDREYEDYLRARAEKDADAAPLIWEALAEGYTRLYRVREALFCLEVWLEQQPDNVRALTLRGNLFRHLGVIQKAVPDYRRAVELDADLPDARWWLALGLEETGHFEEALGHLQHLRPARPDDPELLVHVARCHDKLGQTRQARQTLDAVLAAHPDDALALRTRGQMSLVAGDLAEAEGWLTRAARAAPYDYQAQWSLYQCLQQAGKDQEAKKQEEKARRLKDLRERLNEVTTAKLRDRPDDPAVHAEMGIILLALGYNDLGEHWLFNSLRMDPNYGPAYAALADFYEQKGDLAAAQDYRARAPGVKAPALTAPAKKP
jgi:tetratricopeptide (TPR) repeat protein